MTSDAASKMQRLLKLGSFLIGLSLLLWGAVYHDYPDWDIGISLIMALTTFATAEWSVGTIWQMRWKWIPLAIFWCWLSVDGVYWAYWAVVKPEAMIREGQWLASLCLYLLCGVIWHRITPAIAALIGKGNSKTVVADSGVGN